MVVHSSQTALFGMVESSIRGAAASGVLADADLATSVVAVKAAIDAKKVHVSQTVQKIRAKRAIEVLPAVTGDNSLVTGGSLANIYAAVPGNWSAGGTLGV